MEICRSSYIHGRSIIHAVSTDAPVYVLQLWIPHLLCHGLFLLVARIVEVEVLEFDSIFRHLDAVVSVLMAGCINI